jgi:hypothetical protein
LRHEPAVRDLGPALSEGFRAACSVSLYAVLAAEWGLW